MERAVYSGRCNRVMVYSVFRLGSSIQGKARLALTGSNFDVAKYL